MDRKADFSEWCTGDRAVKEDTDWLLSGSHQKDAAFMLPLIERYAVKSIIELGCGSGILASMLPADVDYLGIDKNTWFLERARLRNLAGTRRFTCFDVRNYECEKRDLATCIAFLKHFNLDEWDRMLAKVLSLGRYGCLGLQLASEDFDNGIDYHHSYVMRERAWRAIHTTGHDVVHEQTLLEWAVDGKVCQSVLVWTKIVEIG